MTAQLTDWPAAGQSLPEKPLAPTTVQLFLYSAVTWNPHRIHYDTDFAKDVEGYDGVLVQGPLLGGWILQAAQEWFRGLGRVATMRHRSVATAVAGDSLVLRGEVTTEATDGLDIDVSISRVGDEETVVCRGTVRIERSGGTA